MMKSMLFGLSIRGKLVTCQYTLSETRSSAAFPFADLFDVWLTCEVFLDGSLVCAVQILCSASHGYRDRILILMTRAIATQN